MKKLMPLIRCTVVVMALVATARAQTPQPSPAPKAGTIVFLGDSLSAGTGVRPQEAFPALVQEKIQESGLPYEVVNAGVGGDTTAGGLRRIDWLLQRKIDVLVIELGGNDGLRGLPIDRMKQNLIGIVEKARTRYPEVEIVLAGMQMPPNVGPDYAAQFRAAFRDVAQKTGATMIPFLLEGVGGVRDLNQSDLIHPNPAGHRIVADVVWKTLEPILRAKSGGPGAAAPAEAGSR